jgi:pyruvate formate lyase activating enzyme
MINRKGIVFDIQQGGMHDGHGIRTVVFLKGCPLRCVWCHNAESIAPEIQPDLKNPGKCFGRELSVHEVMDVVEKDRAFYEESGGGITLSGGEPMLQFEFTKALLMAAREQGIHTCLDTCGYASRYQYRQIDSLIDLFHYDYKASSSTEHELWTGVSSKEIMSNLRMLYERGAEIILRCPIVPGLNATEEHFRGIAALSMEMPKLIINVLPYHNMGRDKWGRSGQKDPLPEMENASTEQKRNWERQLLDLGCSREQLRVN